MKISFFVLILLLALNCHAEDSTGYADGSYLGSYSFVDVEVEVIGGNISSINILRHGGGGKKYADMIAPLIDRIIKNQSTDIDAVTGATVSSENLIKAVSVALGTAGQLNDNHN